MAYKILCVDDDPLTLRAIARMLGDAYRVDMAASGAEAIETISANGPYAAVLSDMHMPGMDGAAFLKRAYQLAPATPRLLLTGYHDPRLLERTLIEGHTLRLLSKPCSLAVMSEAIREAVREYEAALLGRPAKQPAQIDATEIVSPAALAVAAALGSIFDSITADASQYLDYLPGKGQAGICTINWRRAGWTRRYSKSAGAYCVSSEKNASAMTPSRS